jgi:ribosomal protein L37AE/L43A
MTSKWNELAAELLLAGHRPGSKKFKALAERAARGPECPSCGCTEHEENGSDTLCCTACGDHFDITEEL